MIARLDRTLAAATITALLAGALLVVTHGEAVAQARTAPRDQSFDDCLSNDLEKSIRGCTEVLARGERETPQRRSVVLRNRGWAYNSKSEYDRAIVDLSDAIRLDPKNAAAFNNRGFSYQQKRDYERSVADLSEAIRLKPDYTDAYLTRALTYNRQRDFDRALADFAETIRLDPKNAVAYGNRGFAYNARREYDRALSDLDQALRLTPSYSFALVERGYAYNSKRDFDRAIADLTEAVRLDPKNVAAYSNRGYAHNAKKEYDRAIADLNEAIRIDPNNAGAFGERGFAYNEKRDYDRAIADLNTAARLNPRNAVTQHNLGFAFEGKGEPARAFAAYEEALRLDPNHALAKTGRDRVRSAAVAAGPAAPERVAVRPQPDVTPTRPTTEAPKVALPVATGERRVALVIGNGAYVHSGRLPNPVNDATDLARALKDLGFDVVEGFDLDFAGMRARMRDFSRKLDGADVGLFFYAGHGVQVAGRNYLVPIDADLKRAGDLDQDAVDLQSILRPMEAEKRVNLVLLDACRDNPFTRSLRSSLGSSRSAAVGEGLTALRAAGGTLIAFATEPDNVALDGESRNSPFTTALMKHMRTPGLEIEAMFKRVRLDVMTATKGKQTPWSNSSLFGDVFLAGAR